MGDQTTKPKPERRDGPRPDRPVRTSPDKLPPAEKAELRRLALNTRMSAVAIRDYFANRGYLILVESVRKFVSRLRRKANLPARRAGRPRKLSRMPAGPILANQASGGADSPSIIPLLETCARIVDKIIGLAFEQAGPGGVPRA